MGSVCPRGLARQPLPFKGGGGWAALVSARNFAYPGEMADTASPSNDPRAAVCALAPDFAPDPAHETWLEAEIRRTLDAKAENRMTYRSLDGVVRKFIADAR